MTHFHFLCSVGPVREIHENLPHIERCAQNSIRKCGGQLYRKVKGYITVYKFSSLLMLCQVSLLYNCICYFFHCRSFSVLVKDLAGKNHQMIILNLLNPIDEKNSYTKVKEARSTLFIICSYLLVFYIID